jgi:hypothetical protein
VPAFKNLKIWDGLGNDFSPEIKTIAFDQNGISDLGGANADARDSLGPFWPYPTECLQLFSCCLVDGNERRC